MQVLVRPMLLQAAVSQFVTYQAYAVVHAITDLATQVYIWCVVQRCSAAGISRDAVAYTWADHGYTTFLALIMCVMLGVMAEGCITRMHCVG